MTADVGGPGAPRFDVVLRGYDRRQVDEHVGRLQRVVARMRADLEAARSQPLPLVPPSPGFSPGMPPPPGPRARPAPRPRGDQPDMIGTFTDRMQNILQAAEDEAAEIRAKARAAARAETDSVRSEMSELLRKRDGLRAEIAHLRGQADALRGGGPSGRITHSGDDSEGARAGLEPGSGRPPGGPRPPLPLPSRGDARTVVAPISPPPERSVDRPPPDRGQVDRPPPDRGQPDRPLPDRPRPAQGPAGPPLPVRGGPHPMPSSTGVRPGSPPRPGPPRPGGSPSPERRHDGSPSSPSSPRERDVSASPHPLGPPPGRPSADRSGLPAPGRSGPGGPGSSSAPDEPPPVAASGEAGQGAHERSDAAWPHAGPPPSSRPAGPTIAMKLPGATPAGPGGADGPSSGAAGVRKGAPGSDGRTTALPISGRPSTSGSPGRPGSVAAAAVSAMAARTPPPAGPAVTRLPADSTESGPAASRGGANGSAHNGSGLNGSGLNGLPHVGSGESGSEEPDSVQKESTQKESTQKESGPSASAQSGVAQPSPAHDGSAANGSAPSAGGESGSGEKVGQPSSDFVATADSESLWPQFTPDPTPPVDRGAVRAESANATADSTDDARGAAHRLPTEAYPVVGEADVDDAASLRPRNEQHPEPADLFRPGARAEQKPPTDQPKVGRADVTMQVAAARHPVPQNDTVLPPPLGRNDGRRN